jgi:hypothetical protein
VCRLHSRSVETPITLAADGATTVTL